MAQFLVSFWNQLYLSKSNLSVVANICELLDKKLLVYLVLCKELNAASRKCGTSVAFRIHYFMLSYFLLF